MTSELGIGPARPGDHPQTERPRAHRHVLRREPEAHQPQRAAVEPIRRHAGLDVPGTRVHSAIVGADPPRHREQQPEHVLAYLVEARVEHVGNDDAARVRRRQRDVVDSLAVMRDHAAVRQLLEQLARQEQVLVQQRIGVAGSGDERLGARPRWNDQLAGQRGKLVLVAREIGERVVGHRDPERSAGHARQRNP